MRSARFALLLLLTAACAHETAPASKPPGEPPPPRAATPAPAPDVQPVPEQIATDSPRATAGGATFTVPGGWSMTSSSSLVVLQPPEPDSRLAIADVAGADATAAVQAAWATFRAEAKRPIKLVTQRPPRNGWEEAKQFDYETSPNERAVVLAFTLRKGSAWTVVIFEGTKPTFEKRLSPVLLVVQSLRPKGYHKESFAGRKAHPLDAEHLAVMKTFVQRSMEQLGIPGVGLAFVDGGKLVWEGGLGVRELGKPAKVDANTLFLAASNTKGMTTLLLARLVDEKKIRWDEPVVEAYPAFKLGDPETTARVQIQHLVCACTGLPRQDLEWIFEYGKATPASSIALLGTMQPTSKFGEVYQYSNLMASAAGYIGGHLIESKRELGAAYDEAMRKKIFEPLAMRSTTFDMKRALRGNHATPHGEDVDGKLRVGSNDRNYAIVPHRPAGGVWTSAHDFIRYAQLEVARGKLPSGRALVSEENLLARRKPQVPIGEDRTYGMGISVDSTWGVPVVHHGGSMAGFKSDFFVLPDHGVAAVVLTNSDTGWLLLRPFMRRLLEVLFDGNPEAVDDVTLQAARHKAEIAKERERLVVPADTAEVSRLAPKYASTALGGLAVEHRGEATVFDFGEWKSTVASRKNDDGSISLFTIDPNKRGFEFVVGERDGRRVLITRDAQHEYLFVEGG